MATKPAIVVCAYNRPLSLERLFNSLKNAVYQGNDIPLIISIDKSENGDVKRLAEQFEWTHGTKKIIAHATHLGLKEHVLLCGDLTHEYEEIVLLEDDLFVATYFYEFALRALTFYKAEPAVAGISLYNYEVAESCFRPFKAIYDGYDVYFMQVASSWGQAWNRQQWQSFRQWFSENQSWPTKENIPAYLNAWGYQSWKKHFIHYLIDKNLYFVYPRASFSTNFEDPGTNASGKGVFQSTLTASNNVTNLCSFNQSGALYDPWFEIKPQSLNRYNPALSQYDYTTDLYGAKNKTNIQTPFVLTSADLPAALLKFDDAFFPLENNIAFGLTGEKLGLYKTESADFTKRNCRLNYLLEEPFVEKEVGFSLIIPYLVGEAELLKLSLNSFVHQAHLSKELIIVVNSGNVTECEKVVSYTDLNVRLINPDKEENLSGLIIHGIGQSRYEVVSWMRAGSTLESGAFKFVETAFKNFGTLSVVRGINAQEKSVGSNPSINTRPYRFIAADLYRILNQGGEMPDTQLLFFRKHCAQHILSETSDYTTFFYKLLTVYPIHLLVIKLAHCVTSKGLIPINEKLRREFLTGLTAVKNTTGWSSIFVNCLLRLPFLRKDNSWRWFLTSLQNYPDVLRYDEKNGTFFTSKY